MTKKQIKTCETLLLRRRQEILSDLEVHDTEANGLQGDVAADPLDLADGSRSLELMRTLGDAERREIMEIEHALGKITMGSFGDCEWPDCTGHIAVERLEVLPTARMCVKHQEMYEQMARSGQALPARRFLRRDGVTIEEGEEDGWDDVFRRQTY
jgi:DnaK suppressor protein